MSEQQKAEVYDILCEDYEINGSLADFVEGQDKRIKELETASAELLEYAKENQPHGECDSWLGKHPIDVMGKLLKR